MPRKFVYISHLLGPHDFRFLQVAMDAFDETHLITFRRDQLPSWVLSLSRLQVHNLEKEGKPYDDPDESRYSSFLTRFWINWNLRSYGREVSKLIQQIQPNVLQGMWVPTDGFVAARTNFHPLVIAPFVTDVVRKPLVSRRLNQKIGQTLKQADRILVDCEWVKE